MKYLVVVFSVLFLSCNQNKSEEKKENCEKPKEEFQMYKASEMATLMEQMYVHNAQLREKIIKKDSLGNLPDYFSKISKATMTKGKERDAFFDEKASVFIKAQSEIYTSKNTKESFNTMVNACISCHEVKCGGPIERIKTLYIK
jgi:cytochrome c553